MSDKSGKPNPSEPGTQEAHEFAPLGEQLASVINNLPEDKLTLGELLEVFGDEGLLLLTMLLTVVFLIPVSIPGVSTVFGAAILLVGISRSVSYTHLDVYKRQLISTKNLVELLL